MSDERKRSSGSSKGAAMSNPEFHYQDAYEEHHNWADEVESLKARLREAEIAREATDVHLRHTAAERDRLREALRVAEKETHICGERSPYSDDECPGHRIRQALTGNSGRQAS